MPETKENSYMKLILICVGAMVAFGLIGLLVTVKSINYWEGLF